ncbi:MAG TPA: VWA domain-containing protein [Candidatus Dormibacteraeota bacterium]|nr:VWA domain-containing protein [Candidatus Dormibacteraeota bacterium]
MLKLSAVRSLTPILTAVSILFLLASLALGGPFALAQSSTSPTPAPPKPADAQAKEAQKPADAPKPEDQQPEETLKVSVNVVGLFFNVKDKHGALIPSLTKTDFDVFEDGKPQTIKYFAAESNLPLTLGILIDSSGSQSRVLDMEKEVGGAFLKQILTDKDEAYVIDFNVDASLVQDFTRDVHRLQTALNKVKINTGFSSGPIPGGGGAPVPTAPQAGTVLYDAVYLSAHDMLAKEVGRKAMILLTDGEDEGSRLKIKDAIEAAQKADAIVYVLLCADRGFYGSYGMGYSGEGEMRKLTEQTGGRVINVGNKFDKLREAFDQVAAELRSQYNLGYTSTNTKLDGSYRKLEIKSKQSYKIQARAGYYATAREPVPQ